MNPRDTPTAIVLELTDEEIDLLIADIPAVRTERTNNETAPG